MPIRWNAFAGLTLQAPDQSRPHDRYGVKVNWQRISADYAQFLGDANFISGGSGEIYSRDKLVFEANAHLASARTSSSSRWSSTSSRQFLLEPFTPNSHQGGFYVGATLIVPLGQLLGLAPG